MLTVGALTPSQWATRLGRTGAPSVAMQKMVSR